MSAGLALKAARAAGVTFLIEGEHLLLEAASAPPSDVLDLLARHKAGVVALLRKGHDGWSGEDWQALFDERAGIVEHDGGFGRLDAECAFDDCVDHWLALHPPIANQQGHCLRCGTFVFPDEHFLVGS